jgi:putative Holliday junction resolvase
LKEKTKLPVHTYDERLTTKEAEKTLERCRISSRRQRRVIDKISAQLILQGWLERECLKKSK